VQAMDEDDDPRFGSVGVGRGTTGSDEGTRNETYPQKPNDATQHCPFQLFVIED